MLTSQPGTLCLVHLSEISLKYLAAIALAQYLYKTVN